MNLEGWRGTRMLWRLEGETTCSNGVVICGLDLRMDGPSGQPAEPLDATLETIDAEGDGTTAFVVLASLGQSVEFAARERQRPRIVAGDGGTELPPLPNVYRFEFCRDDRN